MVGEKVNEFGDGVAWLRGSVIGKGSYGCVYRATLKNPLSKYSYYPSLMAVKSAEVSASGSIQKEREIFINLKKSPNIIGCFGEETTIGVNGVMVYNLLLEYGSGGTLAGRIKESGGNGLPELEARVYARSILKGLYHIHTCGYVHCDLKPDNILLVRNSARQGATEFNAKIGDFGLAKRRKLSRKRKLEPYWRGTPMYLSPEAVIDSVQEAPCDVWALGCIVLEMLTGKPLWQGETEEILRKIGIGNELPKIPNGVSKEARDFLKGCFVRKSMYRLTAEMLLNHPFVEGLDEDDGGVNESEEVEEFESIAMVYESDTELFSSSDEWDDASGDEWSSYMCEEDADDEIASISGEENEVEDGGVDGTMSSHVDSGLNQSKEVSSNIPAECLSERRHYHPVSFSIPAGI